MSKQEDNLEMSLFDSDNLELNLDGIDLEDLIDDEEQEDESTEDSVDEESSEEDSKEKDNPLNEDEDPEEVVEEEDQEEGSDEDTDEDDSSPNIYSSFASVLSEQGLLPSLDLEEFKIETVDDLTEAFKTEIGNQVKDYLISKVGEEGYDALEKGISLAQYQEHKSTTDALDNITDEVLEQDVELSKRIIYQDYISQGMDEKRALRLLKKSIDLGEETVLEDAKESLQSLKIFQEKQLEKVKEENARKAKEAQAYQEKIDNDLKNAIYNNDEIIKGIKLNKTIKDKVYKSITEVVGKAPNGVMENRLMRDRRENPIEFDTRLYYLYEITKGFSDFSKLVSKAETKAISKLEKSLRNNKFETSGKPAYLEDPDSYDSSLGDELVF